MPDIVVSPSTISVTVASAAAAEWDPKTSVDLFSDFVNDPSPFGISTGTAGNPGSSSYTFTDDETSFGRINLSLSGTQGARIGVYAAQADTSTVNRARKITDGASDFECRMSIVTAVTLQRTIVGLVVTHGPPSTTLIIQDGAAFVAKGASGNWFAVTAASNVMSEVETAYTSASMRNLRITTNAAGTEVRFYIDGNLVRTADVTWDTESSLAWGIEMRDKATGGSGTSGLATADFMRLRLPISR